MGLADLECRPDAEPLPADQARRLASEVPGWTFENGRLRRLYRMPDFAGCVELVRKIAEIADDAGHHPDIHITAYRDLEVVITTHAVRALTQNDFILAARIDSLPGQDLAEAWVSVGSNIEPHIYVPGAVAALRSTWPTTLSPVYVTAPVGRPEQDPYWNAVARVQAHGSKAAFLRHLRDLEDAALRIRTHDRYAARTLDLDLLVWDGNVQPREAKDLLRPFNRCAIHALDPAAAGRFGLPPAAAPPLAPWQDG